MSIIFGRACSSPCASPCCSVPSYTATCRTRSASKSKCGFSEYSASSPPKVYLTRTLSGSATLTDYVGPGCTNCAQVHTYSYSGTCTFDHSTCAETDAGDEHVVDTDCISSISDVHNTVCTVDNAGGSGDFTDSFTATTRTRNGLGCVGTRDVSGSVVETLSSEYTTAMLASDVDTALAAASWSAYAGCASDGSTDGFFDQSSDQLTITKQDSQTKLTFGAPIGSGLRLVYEIWDRTTFSLVDRFCVNLTAGITSYIIQTGVPGTAGASWFVTNLVISCAAC